jgi:hypothetical protein
VREKFFPCTPFGDHTWTRRIRIKNPLFFKSGWRFLLYCICWFLLYCIGTPSFWQPRYPSFLPSFSNLRSN